MSSSLDPSARRRSSLGSRGSSLSGGTLPRRAGKPAMASASSAATAAVASGKSISSRHKPHADNRRPSTSTGDGEVAAPYTDGSPLEPHLELQRHSPADLKAASPRRVLPSTSRSSTGSSTGSAGSGPLEAALAQALLLRFQNVLERQEQIFARVDAAVAASAPAASIAASVQGSRSSSGHVLGGTSPPSGPATSAATPMLSGGRGTCSSSPLVGATLPTATPTPRTVLSARMMTPEELRLVSRMASPHRAVAQPGPHSITGGGDNNSNNSAPEQQPATPPPPPSSLPTSGGSTPQPAPVDVAATTSSGVIYIRPDFEKMRASVGGPLAATITGRSDAEVSRVSPPRCSATGMDGEDGRSSASAITALVGAVRSTSPLESHVTVPFTRLDPPSARRGTLRSVSPEATIADAEVGDASRGATAADNDNDKNPSQRHPRTNSRGSARGGKLSRTSTPDSLAGTRGNLIMIPAPSATTTAAAAKHSKQNAHQQQQQQQRAGISSIKEAAAAENDNTALSVVHRRHSATSSRGGGDDGDSSHPSVDPNENSRTAPLVIHRSPFLMTLSAPKAKNGAASKSLRSPTNHFGDAHLHQVQQSRDTDDDTELPFSSLPQWSALGSPSTYPINANGGGGGGSCGNVDHTMASSLVTGSSSVPASKAQLHLQPTSPGSVTVSPLSRPMSVWGESPSQLGVMPTLSSYAQLFSPGAASTSIPIGGLWSVASGEGGRSPQLPQPQQRPVPPTATTTDTSRSPSLSLSKEREGSSVGATGATDLATRHPGTAMPRWEGVGTVPTTASGVSTSPTLSPSPSPLTTSHDRQTVVVSPLSNPNTPIVITSPGGTPHRVLPQQLCRPPPQDQRGQGGDGVGRGSARPSSPPCAALFQSTSKTSPSPPGQAPPPPPPPAPPPRHTQGGGGSSPSAVNASRVCAEGGKSSIGSRKVSSLTQRSSLSSFSDSAQTQPISLCSVSGWGGDLLLGSPLGARNRDVPEEDVNAGTPSLSLRSSTYHSPTLLRQAEQPPWRSAPQQHQQDGVHHDEQLPASPQRYEPGSDKDISASTPLSPFDSGGPFLSPQHSQTESGGPAADSAATDAVLQKSAERSFSSPAAAEEGDAATSRQAAHEAEQQEQDQQQPQEPPRRVPPVRTMRRPPPVPLNHALNLSPMARHRRERSLEMGEAVEPEGTGACTDEDSKANVAERGGEEGVRAPERANQGAYWSNFEVMHQLEHLPPDLRDLNPFRHDTGTDETSDGVGANRRLEKATAADGHHSEGDGSSSSDDHDSDYEFIEEELFASEEDDEYYYYRRQRERGSPDDDSTEDAASDDVEAGGGGRYSNNGGANALMVLSHSTHSRRFAAARRRGARLPNPVRQHILSRRSLTLRASGNGDSDGAVTTSAEDLTSGASPAASATGAGTEAVSGASPVAVKDGDADWDLSARMAQLAHFQRKNQEALLLDGEGANTHALPAADGSWDTPPNPNGSLRRGSRRRGSLGGGGGSIDDDALARLSAREQLGPSEEIEIVEVPEGSSLSAAVTALERPSDQAEKVRDRDSTDGDRTPSILSTPPPEEAEEAEEHCNAAATGSAGDATPDTLPESLHKAASAATLSLGRPLSPGSSRASSAPPVPPLSIASLEEPGDNSQAEAADLTVVQEAEDEDYYDDEDDEGVAERLSVKVRTPTTNKTPRLRFKHTPRGTSQPNAFTKTRHKASLVRIDSLLAMGTPPTGTPLAPPAGADAAVATPSSQKRKKAAGRRGKAAAAVDASAGPQSASAPATHRRGAADGESSFLFPQPATANRDDNEGEAANKDNGQNGGEHGSEVHLYQYYAQNPELLTRGKAARRRRKSAGDALIGTSSLSAHHHHHHSTGTTKGTSHTASSARDEEEEKEKEEEKGEGVSSPRKDGGSPPRSRRRFSDGDVSVRVMADARHPPSVQLGGGPFSHQHQQQQHQGTQASTNATPPPAAGVAGVTSPSFLYYQQRLTESKLRTRAIETTLQAGGIGPSASMGSVSLAVKRDAPPGDPLESGTLTELSGNGGSGSTAALPQPARTPPPAPATTTTTAAASTDDPLTHVTNATAQKRRKTAVTEKAAAASSSSTRAHRRSSNRRRQILLPVVAPAAGLPASRVRPRLPRAAPPGGTVTTNDAGGVSQPTRNPSAKRATGKAAKGSLTPTAGDDATLSGQGLSGGGGADQQSPSLSVVLPTTTTIVPKTTSTNPDKASSANTSVDEVDVSHPSAREAAALVSHRSHTSNGSDTGRGATVRRSPMTTTASPRDGAAALSPHSTTAAVREGHQVTFALDTKHTTTTPRPDSSADGSNDSVPRRRKSVSARGAMRTKKDPTSTESASGRRRRLSSASAHTPAASSKGRHPSRERGPREGEGEERGGGGERSVSRSRTSVGTARIPVEVSPARSRSARKRRATAATAAAAMANSDTPVREARERRKMSSTGTQA